MQHQQQHWEMNMFKKRIGPNIHISGESDSSGASGCPDMWELESGDIAVIGIRKTSILKEYLPEGAGCGPDEEIVVLPRNLVLGASGDISKLK